MTLTLAQTGWILALLLCLLFYYLRKFSMSSAEEFKNFSLLDLITTKDGHIDQSKVHSEGAFLASTYGFLYLLWSNQLTEWYFSAYMAVWVAARAYAMKKKMEASNEPNNQ